MNIDLDLDDVYTVNVVNTDYSKFEFESPVKGYGSVKILVTIKLMSNAFISEFMNMAFGPVTETGIDDFANVKHVNPSKALSTVLFCGAIYLHFNPGKSVAFNGSDFRRSYFYYRIIQRNFNYLSTQFNLIGIKYFARVVQPQNKFEAMLVDTSELTYVPYEIENHPLTNHKLLYNYFFYSLK